MGLEITIGAACLVAGFVAGTLWGRYLVRTIVRELAEAVGVDVAEPAAKAEKKRGD
jgi:hypothetical protein